MTARTPVRCALVFASIARSFPVTSRPAHDTVAAWLDGPHDDGPAASAVVLRDQAVVRRVECFRRDGSRSAHELPTGIAPSAGPALTPGFRSFLITTAAINPADFAPWLMMRVSALDARTQVEWLLASRIRDSGLVLSRVGTSHFDGDPDTATMLAAVPDVPSPLRQSILTESLNYTHFESGTEIETKLGLGAVSVWALAADFYSLLRGNGLPGFVPDVGNEMQRWNFDIYMYEVLAPAGEEGYISFSPNPSGSHVLHRKRFGADALRREEWSEFAIDVPQGDFEAYLAAEFPQYQTRALPPFTRTRFDVNLESTRSGHVFGIEIDEVEVPSHGASLRQLEMEYHRTRVHSGSSPDSIVPELERLTAQVRSILTGWGVPHEQYFYSKLSFLRDLLTDAGDSVARADPETGT